jgi:hypothetical protein
MNITRVRKDQGQNPTEQRTDTYTTKDKNEKQVRLRGEH